MAKSHDDLVVRVGTDREAFGQLYEQYYPKVLRYCVHRLFSREAAEDVTSAVFLRVARHIRDFQGDDDGDLRKWIHTIAINQVNAHIREVNRRSKLLDTVCKQGAIGACGQHTGGDESNWAKLHEAIGRLKPKQQDAITLRYFEGFSPKEISKVLQMDPAAVRIMLFRAVRKLRRFLGNRLGAP